MTGYWDKPASSSKAGGLVYGASQALRVGWYLSQHVMALRLSLNIPNNRQEANQLPGIVELMGDFTVLFKNEWEDIKSGIYKIPYDLIQDPILVMKKSCHFFLHFSRDSYKICD